MRRTIHFTKDSYPGRASCQYSDKLQYELSKDITQVDCLSCLTALVPWEKRIEVLRKAALEHLSK